ncbi:hypothetical protein [Paenibacillus sp. OK003]|uniref:hypothetical protein n=1 Tax=Paenibacillus sp. OK003 TaxID=1884380 RepID=UPI0008CE5E44|nr:hypothetical protein [Paenibacillus sp. OK003]SEL80982.1 hypothetical protein SAMN05518856_11913 [Paenibacillus sp. OK003]
MIEQDAEKYLQCMEEIKARIGVIETLGIQNRVTIYEIEFIYLQFRKIVELIMFSSISANKVEYKKQHRRFKTHWNAKRILESMHEINPNFYPQPSRQGYDSENQRTVDPILDGYLTKVDLVRLNDQCGEILHATNPYSREKNYRAYYDEVRSWVHKIVNLLTHHQVQLIDSDYQLWVGMQEEMSGRAFYSIKRLEGTT